MRIASLVALLALVQCVPNEPAPKGGPKGAPPAQSAKAKAKAKAKGAVAARPRPSALPRTAAVDTSHDPVLTQPFRDDFERAAPGSDWTLTSPSWRIHNGQLCVQRARNHPAWLRRKIPTNARIEFDATSSSPDGDIKVELWGDGRGQAQGATYDHATSYIAIFGGWKNQFHVLARINEHGTDRQEVRVEPASSDPRSMRVAPNQTYHFKIERSDGKTVRWYVDDLEMLSFDDARPLAGPGHDHLGFNDWEVRVCFDNLTVTPL